LYFDVQADHESHRTANLSVGKRWRGDIGNLYLRPHGQSERCSVDRFVRHHARGVRRSLAHPVAGYVCSAKLKIQ
jgi:hypothetical protein